MKTIPIKSAKRECGDCHTCCEGWLGGEAHGRPFLPGRPCDFLGAGGCSIYKDRPQDPCKNFVCQWLANDDIPMWMRPEQSGVIITKQKQQNIEFFNVTNAGKEMSAPVLNWLFGWAMQNKHNVVYKINGGVYRIGSEEFNKVTFN